MILDAAICLAPTAPTVLGIVLHALSFVLCDSNSVAAPTVYAAVDSKDDVVVDPAGGARVVGGGEIQRN